MINNTWYLVSIVPLTYLHADIEPIMQNFIYVGIFGIAFGIVITAIVSYSIISPINRTILGLKEFETGHLDVCLKGRWK